MLIDFKKILHKQPAKRQTSVQNSRIDEKYLGDLTINDITDLDYKISIGRAPASPRYINNAQAYKFDKACLSRDIEFLNIHFDIDTIIDARNPKYEGVECIKAEEKMCRKKGVKYVNIPLDSAIAPNDEELKLLFSAINNSRKRVYIHCHAGKDRTGILSSCYLAKKYKMSPDEAFRKVFDERPDREHDNRPIQRLKYMSNPYRPEEKNKFLSILENLASE